MLYWAAVFLIIALVAAFLGFAGVATAAAGIAQILFYIFLVIFLVTPIVGTRSLRYPCVRRKPFGQVRSEGLRP